MVRGTGNCHVRGLRGSRGLIGKSSGIGGCPIVVCNHLVGMVTHYLHGYYTTLVGTHNYTGGMIGIWGYSYAGRSGRN